MVMVQTNLNTLINEIDNIEKEMGCKCFLCKNLISIDNDNILKLMKHVENSYKEVLVHKECNDTIGIKRCKMCNELMRGKKNIGLKYCSQKCKNKMYEKIRKERNAFLDNDLKDYGNALLKMCYKKYYDSKGVAYYINRNGGVANGNIKEENKSEN